MTIGDFGGKTYFPTIGLRPAEIRALEELPENTKDRILPIILFAPWVGSNSLEKSLERVVDAFGKRAFFLDLDTAYYSKGKPRDAVIEYEGIVGNEDNYFALVEGIPQAIPVLRIEAATSYSIANQLVKLGELDRNFLVRIRKGAFPTGDISILKTLFDTGQSNYVISIDCEWSDDVLSSEQWVAQIFQQFIQFDARSPVVVSLSSFPKTFSEISGAKSLPIDSRILFNNIKRRFGNQFVVLYGDWATTKPREDKIARTPAARIDYATVDQWVIHRKKDEWDYLDAAKELMKSKYWNKGLHVWGSLMIEKTANGDVSGITTPTKNVAARINLHLHQQAWFDDPNLMLNTDDPYIDDL